MRRPTRLLIGLAAAVMLVAACNRGFQLRKFPTNDSLFAASLAEFNKKKFENAITGFEKLTLDLSARDTLLPLAHWYLGMSHEKQGEHIMAATSFTRLAETFPDDTLADDALLAAGNAYRKLWRNPELDPQYGTLALTQYQLLIAVYPDSPLRPNAEAAIKELDDSYADKDYLNGVFYEKRRAWDSAIIYYKDVVKQHPNSDKSRQALLGMLRVYRKPQMNYKEEAKETCVTLLAAWGTDKEVVKACPPAATADSTGKAAAAAKPADTTKAVPKRPNPR